MTNYQINPENVTAVEKLDFHLLDRRYRAALMIGTGLAYLTLMGLAMLIMWITDSTWSYLAIEIALLVAAVINLSFLPGAYRFRGYALREHDITYRRGIIFPKTTTMPYSRIQQVNVNQNPVTRVFHLYSVELVNGAQTLSSLSIPGLTNDTATRIKALITDKLQDGHD